MTCSSESSRGCHVGRRARQPLGRVSRDGRRSLELLPLEGQGDRWSRGAHRAERRRPRMPNQIGPNVEQRIAFALGHPGYGQRRISAELAREKWGGSIRS